MDGYAEITTQDEMDQLLASIMRFHDSMTKEVHIINRGFVMRDGGMMMNHRFDMQVLIQSQWEPHAVELLFVNVESFQMGDANEYWGASGKVTALHEHVERQTVEMRFDQNSSIQAERAFYRFCPDRLGPRSFLQGEVPAPDAVPAVALDATWRQCSVCDDAWELNPEQAYSYCPKCNAFTKLKTRN